VSTKVARPIPLTIPDIVNVPVPEALVTTKEAVSPFSVRVKLPFGLMLNCVPAVKRYATVFRTTASVAGFPFPFCFSCS
jgi:hypothetical protein